MTLVQLAYFIRIAEVQSLSKAAAIVRIAQPALSRQIRNLEIEVRAPLLVRHAWGVTLTPAGEMLLDYAKRILKDVDTARDAIHSLNSEPSGRVTIGVPASLATSFVPPLAVALRQKYPGLRAHFVDGFSAQLHERCISGDVDLAVLYEDRALGPLVTKLLLSEDLMLIGPPGIQPVGETSMERLLAQPLILPARPNRLRLIVDSLLAEADVESILEVDSLPPIIDLVRRGTGWTVLPYSTIAGDVLRKDVSAWPLTSPRLVRVLLLARPASRQLTPAVAAVEMEISALASSLATTLRWTSP